MTEKIKFRIKYILRIFYFIPIVIDEIIVVSLLLLLEFLVLKWIKFIEYVNRRIDDE